MHIGAAALRQPWSSPRTRPSTDRVGTHAGLKRPATDAPDFQVRRPRTGDVVNAPRTSASLAAQTSPASDAPVARELTSRPVIPGGPGPSHAVAEAFNRELRALTSRDPGCVRRHFAVAQEYTQRHRTHLWQSSVAELFHSQGRQCQGVPPSAASVRRLPAATVEFITTELEAQAHAGSHTMANLALGMPAMVLEDGSPRLVAAMQRVLEGSTASLSPTDAPKVLDSLRWWGQIPASPARDAVLTMLVERVRDSLGGAPLSYQCLQRVLRGIQHLAPHPVCEMLLDMATDCLGRGSTAVDDNIICSCVYVGEKVGNSPSVRRFLKAIAPHVKRAAPASSAPDLTKVLRNLPQVPAGAGGDAFLRALVPWIRRATCRLSTTQLGAVLPGLPACARGGVGTELLRAMACVMQRVDLSRVGMRQATAWLAQIGSHEALPPSRDLVRFCQRLIGSVAGQPDLIAVDVACRIIWRCQTVDEIQALFTKILDWVRRLPETPHPEEERLLTSILQSFDRLFDCEAGSDLAMAVARRLKRLEHGPHVYEFISWSKALRGLGTMPGAHALADALLHWLRRNRLDADPIAVRATLFSALALPGSALGRHAFDAAVAGIKQASAPDLHAMLRWLCFNPQPERVGTLLDAALQRIGELEAAGELEVKPIAPLVAAISMLDPDRPLPTCLTLRYEESVAAQPGDEPVNQQEQRLAAEWRNAIGRLEQQLGLEGGLLRTEFNAWHRGIEMDAFMPALAINLEWDGELHRRGAFARGSDALRDAYLGREGIEVIRIPTGTHDSQRPREIVQKALEALHARLDARVTAGRARLARLQADLATGPEGTAEAGRPSEAGGCPA